MAQTVLITLTSAGLDSGPFDLYSNVDGYLSPFETGITKSSLLAGYTSVLVPDSATTIRVKSVNLVCTNYIDLSIVTSTTTTTSTSSTSTTSTTTSSTTAPPVTYSFYYANEYNCGNCVSPSFVNTVVAVQNPHTLTIGKFYNQIGAPTGLTYKIISTGAPTGPYPIMDYSVPFNSCTLACAIS